MLTKVDSQTLADYYLLYFSNAGTNIIVASWRDDTQKEGCWEKLQAGKSYRLSVSLLGYLRTRHDLSLQLRCDGFWVNGIQVLKRGECFYEAPELHGLFYNADSRNK